jgi:hypothetical protein
VLADPLGVPDRPQPPSERVRVDLGDLDRVPGYNSHIPRENATMATVLRNAGWSTFWVGKDHNTPVDAWTMGSSKKDWPLGLGYDRFYGFIGGETNQWYPDLAEDNHYIEQPYGPEDGWAVAFSTPFRMFKRYSYQGGVADPLVVHWPAGISARGEVRSQYHHCTDIVPTILECCGVEMPEVVDGYQQTPLPGVSMRYSFDAADAPTTKQTQYYEMLGTRGIWHQGWKAVTEHGPVPIGRGRFDQDRWQLFHTDEDRAEAHDLADQHPGKLEELKALWREEARKYDVLPLNDLSIFEFRALEYTVAVPASGQYTYYPGTSEVPEASAANTINVSYKILAEVEFTGDSQGVIFAQGSRFGATRCSSRTGSSSTSTTSSASRPSSDWSPTPRPRGPTSSGSSSPRSTRASTMSRTARSSSTSTTRWWPRPRCGPSPRATASAARGSASATTAATPSPATTSPGSRSPAAGSPRSSTTSATTPTSTSNATSMRPWRATSAGAGTRQREGSGSLLLRRWVREAPDLDQLQAEGLDAVEQPVEGRLVLDRAVEHRLHRFHRRLHALEGGHQRVGQASLDADLVAGSLTRHARPPRPAPSGCLRWWRHPG